MKFLKIHKKDLFFAFLILVSSVIFVFSLFSHNGRPATFDALFHITNIAQFSQALKDGDFPVYWENGFANYGLPIGIVAHQLTSYLGAFLNLALNNATLSFNILMFMGIFLSALFYYSFLRHYFRQLPSFVAVFLFTFAPYRILNVYIRAAGPEVFSNIFLPLILISLYRLIRKKEYVWFYGFILSVFLLSLTHPMNLLIYSTIFIPYAIFLLWHENLDFKKRIKYLLFIAGGGVIGLGLAAYYLVPLNIEIRYFYIGLTKNQLAPNHFLGFLNFFSERWQYETAVDHITRGNILQTGIIETIIFALGLAALIRRVIKKSKISIADFSVVAGLIIIFFMISISNPIYQALPILGNIQFPWRMLNGFIFIPPLIIAYIISKRSNVFVAVLIIVGVLVLRFPQLYGKNFTIYSEQIYYFNQKNVHSDLMSTVWMDYSQNYPVKTKQTVIVEGKGKIISEKVKNSEREYVVTGNSDLRLVDYTFYFPGWKAYVDGKKADIQFQDPNYRGLITYYVPVGRHTVFLRFEDSPTRFIGKILSIVFIFLFVSLFLFRNKLKVIIGKLY